MADTPRFYFACSHEEFPPSALLEQAQAAAQAGFDGLACSDHFQPWFPDGESGAAIPFLGALGQAVPDLPIGTGVSPVIHRYHPGVLAQAFMTLEQLFPGRVFLGAGSGEALNEVPLGLDWPEPGEMLERFDRGLEAIVRLWDGETVTMDGGWFRLEGAKLWTRAKAKPKLYVSAFGPQAARIAAKHADGIWTMGDPEIAGEVLEAYRSERSKLGREPGPVLLQAGFAWASDDAAVVEGAKRWKPTQVDDAYLKDVHTVDDMQRLGEQVTDEEFAKEGFLVDADPAKHVERLREMLDLEPDVVFLQLIGQADPMGSIHTYGDEVLPALRA